MKTSHQLAILAAAAAGLYMLTRFRQGTALNITRPVATTYPNGQQVPSPTPGTPAYNQYLRAQNDQATGSLLNNAGRLIGGLFSGSNNTGTPTSPSGSFVGMPSPTRGSYGPAGDFGAGTYTPTDTYAVNPPYNITYTDQVIGEIQNNPSDSAFLHSDAGYGFYTQ